MMWRLIHPGTRKPVGFISGTRTEAVVAAQRVSDRMGQRFGLIENPEAMPRVGEVWRGLKGDRCRILAVAGRRITVLQLDSGHRVHSDLADFLATYRPSPVVRNPDFAPARGQIWKRSGGGRVRIESLPRDGRVQVTDLDSGNREWIDPLDFKASYKPTHRPNAKGKGQKTRAELIAEVAAGGRIVRSGHAERMRPRRKRMGKVVGTIGRNPNPKGRKKSGFSVLGNTRVTFSRDEVMAFRSRWPVSGLPSKAIWIEFDNRSRDVVADSLTDPERDNAYGSGAMDALTSDARKRVGPARPNSRPRGQMKGLKAKARVRGMAHRNPRDSEVVRARRTFQHLNQIEAGAIKRVRGARNAPKVAVKLGELVSFVYRSDKYGGSPDNPKSEELLYEHRTKRPRPVLATDPDGREVHIVGGRMHPTPDGLVN